MEATKTEYTCRQTPGLWLMLTILLFGSFLVLTEVEKVHGVVMKLSEEPVRCQFGVLGDAVPDGQSYETRVESYSPQPFKPGWPGLVILATYAKDKSHSSLTSTLSTTGTA